MKKKATLLLVLICTGYKASFVDYRRMCTWRICAAASSITFLLERDILGAGTYELQACNKLALGTFQVVLIIESLAIFGNYLHDQYSSQSTNKRSGRTPSPFFDKSCHMGICGVRFPV